MRIATAVFPQSTGGSTYERLLGALTNSARTVCPDIPFDVHRMDRDRTSRSANTCAKAAQKLSFVDNTHKMRAWNRIAQETPDGEIVLLLDADTFLTGDPSILESMEFDVAYTARPEGSSFPLNSGVVPFRGGPVARAFFAEWLEVNEEFLADGTRHQTFRERYGGINQAALGAMLERGSATGILRLECAEWNCEDTTWKAFDPDSTKVVHVKSALRRVCLGLQTPSPHHLPLLEAFRKLDPLERSRKGLDPMVAVR